MTVTPSFGFWCKYCNAARRLTGNDELKKHGHKYLGLVNNEYYETHVTCPVCKNQLVFRENRSY